MKTNETYAGYCTSPEFDDKIKKNRGVLLVCGSCEQHGHHLPLDTDNILGEEIALRIAEKTDMLVMPVVQFGQVWSAKGFPGTVSLSPATLKLVLREAVISLHQQQVRNIVLMTGHNGNYAILKELARELLDEFGWDNIWHFPLPMPKELLDMAKTPRPRVAMHAGEQETAMMLYLHPELVRMDRATQEFPEPPADYPYRPMHWNTFLKTGSFGDGSAATAEYGKVLVEYAVDTTVQLIWQLLPQ